MVKTSVQSAVFLSVHTAGCIHRRRRSAHALLTLRAHVSASSWHFYSKHRIARPFISLPSLSLSLSLCVVGSFLLLIFSL